MVVKMDREISCKGHCEKLSQFLDHVSHTVLVKTGHLFMRNVFTIKSTEDLKSRYKPGSHYLWQTLSRLEEEEKSSQLRTLSSLQVLNCEDFSS